MRLLFQVPRRGTWGTRIFCEVIFIGNRRSSTVQEIKDLRRHEAEGDSFALVLEDFGCGAKRDEAAFAQESYFGAGGEGVGGVVGGEDGLHAVGAGPGLEADDEGVAGYAVEG